MPLGTVPRKEWSLLADRYYVVLHCFFFCNPDGSKQIQAQTTENLGRCHVQSALRHFAGSGRKYARWRQCWCLITSDFHAGAGGTFLCICMAQSERSTESPCKPTSTLTAGSEALITKQMLTLPALCCPCGGGPGARLQNEPSLPVA